MATDAQKAIEIEEAAKAACVAGWLTLVGHA